MAAVAIEGNRAYVGHGYGVDIVDISDPTNPQLSERRTTAFAVVSIANTAASRIAVSTAMGGLYHWDIN